MQRTLQYCRQFSGRIGIAVAICLMLLTSAAAQTTGAVSKTPIPVGQPPLTTVGQSATLLSDGHWLLLGGQREGHAQGDARLFDPRTQKAVNLDTDMALAREGHTATVLPDGDVLIVGGFGADGQLVSLVERYDVVAQEFTSAAIALSARALHTATLLTDGRLLIVGGVGAKGEVRSDVEVVNTLLGTVEQFDARLDTARFGHLAALLPSAPMQVWGGFDTNNEPVKSVEFFDPQTQRFAPLNAVTRGYLPDPLAALATPTVTGIAPESSGISVDAVLTARFSKTLDVTTLNPDTVTLFGPRGPEATRVVAAEAGMLLFVTPALPMTPGATYTLFINGARDNTGLTMPLVALPFHTGAVPANSPSRAVQLGVSEVPKEDPKPAADPGKTATPDASATDEVWNPGSDQYTQGIWRTERPIPTRAGKPSLDNLRSAARSVTALTGLVLKLSDEPLAGVTLRIGKQSVQSDQDGTFLLENLAPGVQTLAIDATTAGKSYGFFEARVEIVASQTNVLPFTIWIPKLDMQNTVKFPSPTVSEVRLTSPRMPGFEVIIPPGTVIRDRAGKIVTEMGITPIPIDRTPFPLPAFFDFAVYYTIQPAGAYIQSVDGSPRQARVVYPNYGKVERASRMLFWNHDPVQRDWYVYGEGNVTPDGKTIVPNANVGINEFSGFMISQPNDPPPSPCTTCPCNGPPGGPPGNPGDPGSPPSPDNPVSPFSGDPVNCGTGEFIHTHTDLSIADVVPLQLTRTHHSGDTASRMFGLGTTPGLDYNLYNPTPGTIARLLMVTPAGGSVPFTCISGCGFSSTAVLEAQETPGPFFKAQMQLNVDRWEATTRDGSIYAFWNFGSRLMYIKDRYGNTTTYTRVPAYRGNLTRIDTPNGRWIEFTVVSNVISEARDNGGRKWTYTYNGSNQLATATDPLNGVWSFTYTGIRMATFKDPRGTTVVTNQYDANGRVNLQTYADGTTTSFAYTLDGNGNVTQADVTDRRGNVRRAQFDVNGNIASNTYALGRPEQQITTYTRQAGTNLLTSMTDALGRRTDYTYDAKGNTLTTTRLAGTANAVTTTYTYGTAFNLVASIKDPLNHTSTLTYDALGNLTRITDPLSHQTNLTYNAQGQMLTVKNALNFTTTYTYDAGVVASVKDPLNRTTTMFTDGAGRVVRIVDPLGNAIATQYDALDRVTAAIDALGNTVRYEYDGNGNLTAHVDQKGNRTEYTFDAMNRLASRKDALLQSETYAYDVASRLQRFTDRKTQVSGFTYDALNRRTQAGFGATIGNPTAYSSTIGTTLDAGNRLTQANDSQNGIITRSYDGLDRLTGETTSLAAVAFTYDAAGRRLTRAVPGQSTLTYAWDNANRLSTLTQGTQSVAFTYDNANRRTQVTLPNGIAINSTFDAASQLTGITYKLGATTLGDLTYAYDTAGRRTSISGSFARSDLPATIATTAHNADNQLTQWGAPTLTYDLNGNLTADGIYNYTWNARNQLVQLQQGVTTVASYQYDAFGRRQQKVVNGTTTQFVYDGQNFVQERDGAGSVTANLLTGLGLDQVYARTKGAITSSFLMDHLGTIIAEADASGVIQTSYSYEPYGKTTQTGTASDNSQRYTGREQDTSDLYYYRARYYSPTVDRFVNEDPIGISGGINLYGYVGANPVSNIDPSGLACVVPPIMTPAECTAACIALWGVVLGACASLPPPANLSCAAAAGRGMANCIFRCR